MSMLATLTSEWLTMMMMMMKTIMMMMRMMRCLIIWIPYTSIQGTSIFPQKICFFLQKNVIGAEIPYPMKWVIVLQRNVIGAEIPYPVKWIIVLHLLRFLRYHIAGHLSKAFSNWRPLIPMILPLQTKLVTFSNLLQSRLEKDASVKQFARKEDFYGSFCNVTDHITSSNFNNFTLKAYFIWNCNL